MNDLTRSTAARRVLFVSMALAATASAASAQNRIRVVTTLPTYASITRELTGDLAEVRSIARGDEDAHFVNARPSFAAMIQQADLFVTTGLDLELWVPGLLDRANNSKVVEGAPGHVVVHSGIEKLDKPASVSRTGGDVHIFGNPHLHTDPINAILIARNIHAGLLRVDPANAAAYDANLSRFRNRIIERLFGTQLVEMLGGETLMDLAVRGQFWSFATEQELEGHPLTDYLGGWLAAGAPFRDKEIVCYHKNWAYFSARFLVACTMYVEPKPGIPASPGHVRDVIAFIRDHHIPVVFAANYFSATQVERVASRAGAVALIVPEHVEGADGVDDYFKLVDTWVNGLSAAFQGR